LAAKTAATLLRQQTPEQAPLESLWQGRSSILPETNLKIRRVFCIWFKQNVITIHCEYIQQVTQDIQFFGGKYTTIQWEYHVQSFAFPV
jgi:hypothetical protein